MVMTNKGMAAFSEEKNLNSFIAGLMINCCIIVAVLFVFHYSPRTLLL